MPLTALVLLLAAVPPIDLLRDVPGLASRPTAAVSTTVDGVRVTQRSCTAARGVSELREHFARVFETAGLYLAPEQDTVRPQRGEQVTGLDTENLLSYTVLLQPSGKQTTIVLAVADLGAAQPQASAPPIGPVMPGATQLTSFQLETETAMTYAVRATPAEIKSFYRDTLQRAGFVEGEELVFSRGAEVLTLIVSPGVSERYVMVQKSHPR